MIDRLTVVETFLAYVAPSAKRAYAALPNLADLLADMIAQAHAAWPQVALDERAFLAFLAERLPADRDAAAAVEGLQVADLSLVGEKGRAMGYASGQGLL